MTEYAWSTALCPSRPGFYPFKVLGPAGVCSGAGNKTQPFRKLQSTTGQPIRDGTAFPVHASRIRTAVAATLPRSSIQSCGTDRRKAA